MGAGVHQDPFEVFSELRPFLLTVLDHIVGQVEEGQLPAAFS